MKDQGLIYVVFDTTTIYQATLSPRGPAETQALSLIEEGKVEAFMSNRVRAEYEKTLSEGWKFAQRPDTKPNDKQRLKNLTMEFIEAQLKRLDEQVNRIVNPPLRVEYARDREDEPILNLAIHIEADYIVSRDPDLLDLNDSPDWQRWYPSIRIVPAEYLRHELGQRQAQEHNPQLDTKFDPSL